MLDALGAEMKKILLAGIGAVALTTEKAKDLVDDLVKKGEITVEQGKVLNEELKRNVKAKVREQAQSVATQLTAEQHHLRQNLREAVF